MITLPRLDFTAIGQTRQALKQQAWIVLAAVAVLFTNLGVPALWDDDEPRNAQCAREMLDRGDWIVPTFNQELRTDKPVLLYWLMFGAYTVLGPTELAARCSSAIFAVGTSLVTYHLGRRLFRAEVGFWAGLMVATSLMFVVDGRAATPDSTLVFFTTLSMWLFVGVADAVAKDRPEDNFPLPWRERAGVRGDRHEKSEGYSSADPKAPPAAAGYGFPSMYAAMGAAVLAKGPVGVVLPGAVLALHSVCRIRHREVENSRASIAQSAPASWRVAARQWCQPRLWLKACWSLRPLTAIVVLAAIVLPWYVCVGIKTEGQWLAGFLGKHNFQRFLSPMETHRGPVVYYIPAILVGFFPWSVLLPLALLDLFRQLRHGRVWKSGYQFVLCWTAVYVGFFSFAATKLPSYVLPAYPALALMTAAFLVRWVDGQADVRRCWMQLSWVTIGMVGVGLLIGLPIAAYYLLPGEESLGLLGLILLAGAGAGLTLLARQQRRLAAATLAATAVAFATAAFGIASVQVSRYHNNMAMVEYLRRHTPEGFQLSTFRYNTPSLVYYANRRVTHCDDAGEVREFFEQSPQPFLVTYADRLEELKGCLPADSVELLRQRRFLRPGELVLIGRATGVARSNLQTMR